MTDEQRQNKVLRILKGQKVRTRCNGRLKDLGHLGIVWLDCLGHITYHKTTRLTTSVCGTLKLEGAEELSDIWTFYDLGEEW